ncbi:hypothetical protein DPMN_116986 [Dreissena polymorpha]|nr:hypothetical protein DPMN_116986 [Dreissena polymorpha]
MVSCPSMNDTISCADGCCGNVSDQKCCDSEILTESSLVIICIIAGVLVIAVAAALIICITSKNKNRVVRISPRHRTTIHQEREISRRRAFPKPPPYSELPPQYEGPPSAESPVTPLPGSTLHRTESIRSTNGIRIHASGANDSRQNNIHCSTDPPPYLSVIAESRSNWSVPYTSGELGGPETESGSI